ncbi:aspartate carbamoyltransferase regulatory subunit [Acidiplasma cupricumulans]|uniref:aspartate carbamoyltransferase regulatory subunit n=1 Tax=Acidiplasma cupricumulans TaxID=312540 RepID=UPI000782E7AD|nr:aspartate carbamoyltransferase regulatory subunit [Acidiplasma cupricumulans]
MSKIKDGTVIDHIPSGKAVKVLNILKISENTSVSIGIRVPSNMMGFKDVIKIENKFLEKIELDKISLIAPSATISIIKDYDITEKFKVDLPESVIGIVRCTNQNCITNAGEPVSPEFKVISANPLALKCIYCKREMSESDVINSL